MLHGTWSALARGRVNPIVPTTVALIGLVLFVSGRRWIGAGITIGSMLAYVNGIILSQRVDFAAGTGNVAGALMVMQLGMLVTMAIVGVAEVILIKISLSMAVASAAGFAVAQIAILAMFYFTHGRADAPVGTEA